MNATIEWNTLSLSEWSASFRDLPYSTLPQSYEYARAYCTLNHLSAHWGVIKIDGERAGLVQLFEASILNKLFHSLIIDRGPLWYEGYNTPEALDAFLQTLNHTYPPRIGRKIRVIPETQDVAQHSDIIEKYYKQASPEGYQTILIDLEPDLEKIREGFHSKWRNQLRKAEKSGSEFYVDDTGETLSHFLSNYEMDRQLKSYTNLLPSHIPLYFKFFSENGSVFLAHIGSKNKPLASALIFIHGNTATWQIGWLSELGRKICANHLLLYRIMTILKDKNILWFDLGGVNDGDASGIKHFKTGMGGRLISSAGLYS